MNVAEIILIYVFADLATNLTITFRVGSAAMKLIEHVAKYVLRCYTTIWNG